MIDFELFNSRMLWIKVRIPRVKLHVVEAYVPAEGKEEERLSIWNLFYLLRSITRLGVHEVP